MVRLTRCILQRVPEYWKRYTDRWINAKSKPARYVPLRGWVGEDARHFWVHTNHHPSNERNQLYNIDAKRRGGWRLEEELLEPIKEWTILLGDRVEVLVGKDKGKHGIVSKIVHDRNWVFVESLNTQTTKDLLPGQQIQIEEMPLEVNTEVALVDPVTEKAATKVEWRYTETGERIRLVYPSQVILKPTKQASTLADGVSPDTYIANPKTDTEEADLEEVTCRPKLKTFEQDIMDSMDIKDSRQRGTTYWY